MNIRPLSPPQVQAGSSAAGRADRNVLLGTWKLKSHVATTDAGEKSMPYGEHPTGYLSYSVEGRMQVIGTSDGRTAQHGAVSTDDERVTLYETMFAYAGTYEVEAGKVIHHVDISWNHVWTGTDQVRFYEVNGNTLTITSRLIDPASGTGAQYVVTWEKVKGPY